jgi:hypothetical protein
MYAFRLAAIDESEKFSQEYPQYHEEVMGILAEFIRNYPDESYSAKIPRDMQAALTVIANNNTHPSESDEPLDLSYSDMSAPGGEVKSQKSKGKSMKSPPLE